MRKHAQKGKHRAARRRMTIGAAAAIVLGLITALLSGSLPSAPKAEAAETNWSRQLWNSSAIKLVTTSDGGVTAVDCYNGEFGSDDAIIRHYSPSGTVSASLTAKQLGGIPICSEFTLAASTENIIYMPYNTAPGAPSSIVAIQGASVLWTATLPYNCSYGHIDSLKVGGNGNVYSIMRGCTTRLYGLAGILQPGQTVPNTIANTRLGSIRSELATYDDGIAVKIGSELRRYDLTGNLVGTVSIDNVTYWQELAATTNGRVFAPTSPGSTSGCTRGPQGLAGGIMAYDGASVAWAQPFALGQCVYIVSLRPTPSGGVAAVVVNTSDDSRTLVVLDDNGDELWAHVLPDNTWPATYFGANYSLRVTTDGNVVWGRKYATTNGQLGIHIELLNGTTGTLIDEFDQAGGASQVTAWGDISQTFTLSSGRFYAVLRPCQWQNRSTSCWGTSQLHAYGFPEARANYPDGLALGNQPAPGPELNLVVMGDSYSSGEGVEPFEADTEVSENRCHRSELAYAKLLDTAPGVNLRLTDFIACSSATTDHIVNVAQYTTQSAQVDSLPSDTNIVVLTIGGNDVEFGDYTISCLASLSDCDGAVYDATVDLIDNYLPHKLDTAYNAIRAKLGASSTARVLVLGYPQLIAAYGSPEQPGPLNCYLEPEEQTAAANVVIRLNSAIQDAVERQASLAGADFEYVDVMGEESPFYGHELCQEDSFFNSFVMFPDEEYSFHPNQGGHDAYKEAIVSHLQE